MDDESIQNKYKVYSTEFKAAKIEEFLKSGKSEAAFCKENDICVSTFRSWRKKVGKAAEKDDGQADLTLLDVTDRIQNAMNVIRLQNREISFSVNGFRISIEEKDLGSFIKGMMGND